MASTAPSGVSPDAIEALLREELAGADHALANIGPILLHLLGSDDNSIFSDEIIARLRGMLRDLARQLIIGIAEAAGHRDPQEWAHKAADDLQSVLSANRALLAHVHAVALEWQLTERLRERLGLDPVLSPLLQAQIASTDGHASAVAMNLLAAQARFGQYQRRMQLPLGELPGDLFHQALMTMRAFVGSDETADGHAAQAERAFRDRYEEGSGRLALLHRVVAGMGADAVAALSVEHAGVALFLTGLSIAAGQPREMVMMTLTESQFPRLALLLSASGLKADAIARQFLSLHPDVELPEGLDALRPDRAAALLAAPGEGIGR